MSKKILVIDDNKEICEMYKTIFENNKFKVEVEFDGLKGIIKAIEFKPDIILLDIMMPQTDGFEVLRTIKTQSSIDTKIIVNSNLSDISDEEKALNLQAEKFLRKSDYTPYQVADIIKKIIDKNKKNTNPKKIMIIDDNEEICEMYKIALKNEWYNVEVENNGLNGLITATKFKPDIILLDIMMPQINGYEVLDSIKRHSSLNTIIIVISNLDSKDDEKKSLELGAKKFLRKSEYSPIEITSIIKEIIKEKEENYN